VCGVRMDVCVFMWCVSAWFLQETNLTPEQMNCCDAKFGRIRSSVCSDKKKNRKLLSLFPLNAIIMHDFTKYPKSKYARIVLPLVLCGCATSCLAREKIYNTSMPILKRSAQENICILLTSLGYFVVYRLGY
jgi:hypothetical protein